MSSSAPKALKNFKGDVKANKYKELPEELKAIILDVKTFGISIYPWELLKELYKFELKRCIDGFLLQNPFIAPSLEQPDNSVAEQKERLLDAVDQYDDAPFTLQRLTEILLSPEKYCNQISKLLFSFEKLLSVSTTMKPATEEELKQLQENCEKIRQANAVPPEAGKQSKAADDGEAMDTTS